MATESESDWGPSPRYEPLDDDDAGRDRPLGLRWRASPDAIRHLGLEPGNRPLDATLNGILTEAYLAYEGGRAVSYSRRPDFYTNRRRYYPSPYRYSTVLPAVAIGCRAELLIEHRAEPGTRGWQSTFEAAPKLIELWGRGIECSYQAFEPIRLRDRQGNLIPYDDTRETSRLRREIQAINAAQRGLNIGLPSAQVIGRHWLVDGTYVLPQPFHLHRVFNRGSWAKGGRAYGYYQNLPKERRLELTIDGCPVAEPDYSGLHPSILYAQKGLKAPAGDPYETGEFPRKEGKVALNIAFNAETRRSGIAAIVQELKCPWEHAEALYTRLERKHPAIAASSVLTPESN